MCPHTLLLVLLVLLLVLPLQVRKRHSRAVTTGGDKVLSLQPPKRNMTNTHAKANTASHVSFFVYHVTV